MRSAKALRDLNVQTPVFYTATGVPYSTLFITFGLQFGRFGARLPIPSRAVVRALLDRLRNRILLRIHSYFNWNRYDGMFSVYLRDLVITAVLDVVMEVINWSECGRRE